MGDMNAKLGRDNEKWKGTMGTERLGEMNKNETLFVDFCAFNELVIGGSLFPHKLTHKTPENQIDHTTIARKWRKLLLDMRVKRGADTESDHHLLIGEFRLKLAAKTEKVLTSEN